MAVKLISGLNVRTAGAAKCLVGEVVALSIVSHPHIIQLVGFCWTPVICLIIEYMPGGTLADVLSTASVSLTWTDLLPVAVEISSAVAYLHDFAPPFLHRDIKTCKHVHTHTLSPKPALNCYFVMTTVCCPSYRARAASSWGKGGGRSSSLISASRRSSARGDRSAALGQRATPHRRSVNTHTAARLRCVCFFLTRVSRASLIFADFERHAQHQALGCALLRSLHVGDGHTAPLHSPDLQKGRSAN